MDNHAHELQKNEIEDSCAFEEIIFEEKIKDKNAKVTIYKKGEPFHSQYVAFSGNKKKLKALVKRTPESCSVDDTHNFVEISPQKGETNNISLSSSTEIPVQYLISDSELLKYIWPNEFHFEKQTLSFGSCKGSKVLTVKTYPDIKWGIVFSFGIDNPIGIKWKELNRHGVKYVPIDAKKKAGQIGADTKWGRGTTFELGFSAKRDDDSKEISLKLKYEKRFQSLVKILNALKKPTDVLMKKIGGKFPITVESVPPSLSLEAQWQLCRNEEATQIGKTIELAFKADPIIGVKGTLDLLGVGAYFVNPGAFKLYEKIKKIMSKGYDGKVVKFNGDIFVHLILTGELKGDASFSYNTLPPPNSQKTKSEIEFNLDATIGFKLEAGIRLKGEVVVFFFKAYAEAEASASLEGGALGGLKVASDTSGVYFTPKIEFEGAKATVIVYIEVGFTAGDFGGGIKKEYKIDVELFPPFDLIEFLRDDIGVNTRIELIKNSNESV
jgi:hypothetical protein